MNKLFIIFMLILVIAPSNAQDIQKYDKYDCIAEKVLENCKEKVIYLAKETGAGWMLLNNEDRNKEFLRDYIIKKEKEFLKANEGNIQASTTYGAIFCKYPEENIEPKQNNVLGFYIDHFIWHGSTIDCAWIRNQYNIDKVELSGKCPALVIGDNNTVAPDCRDSTIYFNFSINELVLF